MPSQSPCDVREHRVPVLQIHGKSRARVDLRDGSKDFQGSLFHRGGIDGASSWGASAPTARYDGLIFWQCIPLLYTIHRSFAYHQFERSAR